MGQCGKRNQRLVIFMIIFSSSILYILYQKDFSDLHKYLLPPHPRKTPENRDEKFSQAGQEDAVFSIFSKEDGFFIEMGAFDGKHHSNTLWLEQRHGWRGLLVEPNPDLCRQIDSHMRNAWRLCACISNKHKSVEFVKDDLFGAVKEAEKHEKLLSNPEITKIPCYSMKEVLEKIEVGHVDYFSLDVEGSELHVLESLKDDLVSGRLSVDVWTIEFLIKSGSYVDFEKSAEKLSRIQHFFAEVGGYFLHSSLKLPTGDAVDVVFVNTKTWCKSHDNLPNGKLCTKNQ